MTAEYGMLPRSTHTRSAREAARGKQSGRTQEIQRLIGRSLRAVIDLKALGPRTITIDCDVLQADGGTRTASITGGYVALAQACARLVAQRTIAALPLHGQVAAVSVGIVGGSPVLDLDYREDSQAETDMNVVMRSGGGFIELQGTAEGHAFPPARARCHARSGRRRHRAVVFPADPDPRGPARVKKTVLASGNAGKLKELTAILAPLGLELIAQSALGIESPPETGTTFLENALIKARHAARVSGLPALADDSGIEVDALDGRPGVRSARFAGEGASDADNLHKLLAELHDVPAEFRQARYHCVIAFVRRHDDSQPIVAQGRWEGRIALEPRGNGGFGYDPIFLPADCPGTAAQLDPKVKNEVSHRAQALRAWAGRSARRARCRNDAADARHTRNALRAGRALRRRQDLAGASAARAHARAADVDLPHHATAAPYRGAWTGVLLHHASRNSSVW